MAHQNSPCRRAPARCEPVSAFNLRPLLILQCPEGIRTDMLLRVKHPGALVLASGLLSHANRLPGRAIHCGLWALPERAFLLQHVDGELGELVPDLVRSERGRGDVVVPLLDFVDLYSYQHVRSVGLYRIQERNT